MIGHIPKAADLIFLRQQPKKRVDQHIYQRELALDGDVRKVAQRHRYPVAAGLAATDPKLVPYGAMTATFYTGVGCLLAPSVLYLLVAGLLG